MTKTPEIVPNNVASTSTASTTPPTRTRQREDEAMGDVFEALVQVDIVREQHASGEVKVLPRVGPRRAGRDPAGRAFGLGQL